MSTEQFAVDDEVAVVTGASSGIGRTVAERFAAGGARVAVCSRAADRIEPVAEGIVEEGGDAVAVECDVRERDEVEAFVDATVEAFGGIDLLVNNAGASFVASFEQISPNGWDAVVETNLTGTYHCTHAAGEHLADGGGAVVNVASAAGRAGAPYMTHYGAAKAGIVNLTRSLAYEWADRDVRVNCVAPGYVATPGVAEQMGVTADDVDRDEVDRRIGTSAEIADVVQFLASDAGSYLVGETIYPAGKPRDPERPGV
jgi:NAD(P)-dependent dehydrogenase (short-subunit alcohol dehydrogenase family)